MTTPTMSWYTDRIRRSPALLWAYRRHKWHWYQSVRAMTSFSLEQGSDIFEYRKGWLIIRKDPPHPSWNVPEEYLAPVRIRLSDASDSRIRRELNRIPFPSLRTDHRSFVNLQAGGFVSLHFTASFRFGSTYHFADDSCSSALSPLAQMLREICAGSKKYRQLQALEARIFNPEQPQ